MAKQKKSHGASPEQSQAMTNQLVRMATQLQKWAAAQTPMENDYQITFPQVAALYSIRYGADTPGAVATRLRITPRAVTSHIDVLEDRGLLTRSIDPDDRRRTLLTLTAEGTDLSRHIEATALTTLRDFLHALDDEEYGAIETALGLLNSFLISVSNPDDPLPSPERFLAFE